MTLLDSVLSIIISVNLNICLSSTIDTTVSLQYASTTISCPEGEDCTVRCDHNVACFNSHILCPNNYSCNIQCIANFAGGILNVCNNATINCLYSSQCDVSCLNPNNHPLYSGNACKDVIIHWPLNKQYTLTCDQGAQCVGVHIEAPSDNEPFTLDCDIAECQQSIIHCPNNSSCTIKCEQVNSCYYAIIHCGTSSNSECSIACAGSRACEHIVVTGKGTISKCSGLSTCASATFPQPPSNIDYSLFCGGSSYACKYANIQCPSNAACHITCEDVFGCDNAVITWPTEGNHDTSLTCVNGVNESCANVVMPRSKMPTSDTRNPTLAPTRSPVISPTSLSMGPTILSLIIAPSDDSQSKKKDIILYMNNLIYIFIALAVALCFCFILNVFLCCKPKKEPQVENDSDEEIVIMERVAQEIRSPTLGPTFNIPGLPKVSSLLFWENEGEQIATTAISVQEIENVVLASDKLMQHVVEEPDIITIA